jgi:hypothetical protein
MKLIENCNFSGNLSEVANYLTQRGILVSTTDDYANLPGKSYATRNVKIGIWIHMDDQYDDAIALLKNKNHTVKNPLSIDDMQELKEQAKKNFYSFTIKIAIKAFTIFSVIIGLILYLHTSNIF